MTVKFGGCMATTHAGTPAALATNAGTILFGTILIAINMRTSTAGVGAVLPNIAEELDWSAAMSSGLVVIPLLCYAAVSPLAPTISRTFGVRGTVLISLAAIALGIALRSCPGPVWIWIGTGVLGGGIGILNVVTPALIKSSFPNHVGPVTATYSAIQGGAAALGTAAVALILGLSGDSWRLALASSIIFAIVGFAFWALWPIGTERPARLTPSSTRVHAASRNPWRRSLAWHLAIFMSMQASIFYVLITWLPTIEQEHGTSAVQASLHQSYLQGASLLATVLGAGLLLRGPSQRAIVVVSTAIMATGIVGILTVPGLAAAWSALVGAGGGLTLVTALSLFGFRTRNPAETAAVSAMGQAVGYLVAAAGPVLLGLLHDMTGSWTPVLLVLLGLLMVQTIAGLRAAQAKYVWPETASQDNICKKQSCLR
ncbi:MFS transporter [Rhodococcus pyridinivorans]|uniref:MFS transporter n=1 Tax=Rhodococcus pyridinivorans TaxID=103816 RepID=UPI0034644DA2